MKTNIVYRLSLLTLLVASCGGVGAAERLDDSASPQTYVVPQQVLSEQGLPLADTLNPEEAHINIGLIHYRLATANYIGRKAKIYYVVPFNIDGLRNPNALKLQWTGGKYFADGSLRVGQRALVWSGTIIDAWLEDSLNLKATLLLKHVRLSQGQDFGVEPYFEIE